MEYFIELANNYSRQACVLRDQGWTFQQIGAALKIPADFISHMIKAGRRLGG